MGHVIVYSDPIVKINQPTSYFPVSYVPPAGPRYTVSHEIKNKRHLNAAKSSDPGLFANMILVSRKVVSTKKTFSKADAKRPAKFKRNVLSASQKLENARRRRCLLNSNAFLLLMNADFHLSLAN